MPRHARSRKLAILRVSTGSTSVQPRSIFCHPMRCWIATVMPDTDDPVAITSQPSWDSMGLFSTIATHMAGGSAILVIHELRLVPFAH
eukprot:3788312-Pleurochrysis_carterae.AAC.1